MKPISPHDPLDALIAAALHGELTPEERTQFESRLQNEPAARAAYQESQLMHDLLEKTHATAQPDPAFEQRMVSGVRRKIQDKENSRETAWESVVVLWNAVRGFSRTRYVWQYGALTGFVLVVGLSVLVSMGNQVKGTFATISNPLADATEAKQKDLKKVIRNRGLDYVATAQNGRTLSGYVDNSYTKQFAGADELAKAPSSPGAIPMAAPATPVPDAAPAATTPSSPTLLAINAPKATGEFASRLESANSKTQGWGSDADGTAQAPAPAMDMLAKDKEEQQKIASLSVPAAPNPDATRKLIRNAELELEVKSYQAAMDQIAALTKDAGGYVDTSSSQRGGNGKLQGTVVVKVLPQNLDAFLLKLRDLGELKNQSLSTEDVTKDYFDTQARLENSRRMEEQLQQLLQRDNGKVADLLQVERELGRVRGEIEQMQGQLKLYDFQVQYATVTMQVREKDLNEAAAYLLKETDDFSLFATNVEDTFQQARHAADDFKAQVLVANLNHNSGTNVSAMLVVSVPPDQIEPFLTQIKTLGRLDNFTRQTQRVAKDGGDSDNPADQTLTEKDKVLVNIDLHSDDESPQQQTDLSLLATGVDDKAQQIKKDATADGVEVKTSSFERQPDGTETAQMTFRLPMSKYPGFIENLQKLGKVESLTVHRDDRPDQARADDFAPAEISLRLHNQGDIVADNNGLWATLRRTFGDGVAALLGSVSTICVVVAFLVPWVFVLALLAWAGRRIYIWRKK